MVIDYAEVGRRMAKRRKELSLKQREVCEMVDANYKYISNLETGRSVPSLEMVMKLCKALDTTPDYLLLGTDTGQDRDTDRQLFEKISRLSPKEKRLIGGIIDLLGEN
ncbi:MAG: helix-turn-helix transcriptional regulator [Oscillospiraceae bacterium]|nr:helix-turn-helix transcriptional regulator [Oscillospiraceae bacterium]